METMKPYRFERTEELLMKKVWPKFKLETDLIEKRLNRYALEEGRYASKVL